eukprot:COSAG05_NODE_8004_length_746_cov_10.612056_1_plen_40_part_10
MSRRAMARADRCRHPETTVAAMGWNRSPRVMPVISHKLLL